MNTSHRVVITGMGVLTPVGLNCRATFDHLVAGVSGIGRITLFDPSRMLSQIAGEVKNFNPNGYMDKKMARRIGRYAQFAIAAAREAIDQADLDLSQAVRRYAAFAALIVASGLALPFVAGQLAASMGWSESFVGTQLVAVATSLPEIAVTFHAVRIGALDMAVAGILGSSLFNVTIIALDDLMFAPGPIFGAVTSAHAGTAGTAIAMSAIVIVALSMPALYLANAWIAFGH